MKKTIFILLLILTISCNKEENVVPNITDKTYIKLITGINFRQNFDDQVLQYGNPNVLVNNMFIIYPNPAIESVVIQAEENINAVWLVKANPEKIHQEINFNNVLNTNLYNEQLINSISNLSLTSQSSNNIVMNIDTLEQGYYRIFVKIGGVIYWDNLYKYENGGNNEEQFDAFSNFWN
jgi:hypothetical protein